MTQTFLVTGGAGFVGQGICRDLLRKQCRVKTLDLEPLDPSDASSGVDHVRGDIRDSSLVRHAAAGVDGVIHAAAALPLWKPSEIQSINVDGTKAVLEACAALNIPRVVHISTTAVYGIPGRGPILETDPLESIDDYSRSKIAAEDVALSFRDRLCVPILRAKLVVGPGRLGIFDIIFDWAKRGKHIPILGNGENLYQMVHIEDLTSAIWLAGTLPPEVAGDTFNIAADKYGTVRQDFQALLDHAGFGRSVVRLPAKPVAAALWVLEHLGLSPLSRSIYGAAGMISFVSIEKARRRLGWMPVYSNVDALVQSYDWYVAHFEEFQGKTGVTHRSPLKQGALAIVRAFF
jgi:nucleoside-diphosphate-sugar epimerase